MKRTHCLALAVLIGALSLSSAAWADNVQLDVAPRQFSLQGLHEGLQLVVTAVGNTPRDLTRKAGYRAEPAGIVRVTEQGYVRPIGKGEAIITIEVEGQKQQT